jgi:NAD(P)-dependent dehydrogenase (short-subunit alcohol dehydrogenase family)
MAASDREIEKTVTRVSVVTGANRGIGLEVVRQLMAAGDTVVLGSRDEVAGRRAAATLGSLPGTVVARRLDVLDQSSIEALAGELASSFGHVDVLVNNAAIHYDTWQRPSNADLQIVEEAWQTNVLGAWRVALAFIPLLRASSHGRIVNVSSEAGSLASMVSSTPAYSVSKAALNALTKQLAADLRSDRILVNSVCPGWVATDMGGHGGRPVAEGAASVRWAIDLADDGPTGGFYRDGLPVPF